jgi:pimeloyl-ACP methyl ester carboxylesterase
MAGHIPNDRIRYLPLRYSLEHPAEVRELILVDPFISFYQLSRGRQVVFRYPRIPARLLSVRPRWLIAMRIDLGSISFNRARFGFSLPKPVRQEGVINYGKTSPNTLHLLWSIRAHATDFAALAMPALILWGDQDRTLSSDWFADLAKSLPNATSRVLQAGHAPQQTNQEEFNEIVSDFLGKLTSTTTWSNLSAT